MPDKTAKYLCPPPTHPPRHRSLRKRRLSNEYSKRGRSGKRKRESLSDFESVGSNFESLKGNVACDHKILMPRRFIHVKWPLWKDMLLIDQLYKAKFIWYPYLDFYRENEGQYSWTSTQLWDRIAHFLSVQVHEHAKIHNLELHNSPVIDCTLDTVLQRAELYIKRFSEIAYQRSEDDSESEFILHVRMLFDDAWKPLGPVVFSDDDDDHTQ